ncbi:MAG TPA: hypothetical protein VEQ59_07820, partial [Polyangiaceae bacterium]|nr:hypothetical protein [Polyangiaceae bacterium]
PLVLSRLAELPDQRAQARARLEKLAADKSDYGLEASYVLASFGSRGSVERIEGELSHERASRRLRAALALVRLGQKRRVAARLADNDPFVRATLACRLTEAR